MSYTSLSALQGSSSGSEDEKLRVQVRPGAPLTPLTVTLRIGRPAAAASLLLPKLNIPRENPERAY